VLVHFIEESIHFDQILLDFGRTQLIHILAKNEPLKRWNIVEFLFFAPIKIYLSELPGREVMGLWMEILSKDVYL
jgi:hypothetical protein